MRKQSLIINLPGNSKAVKEVGPTISLAKNHLSISLISLLFLSPPQNIQVLLPSLPHAIGLLRQDPNAAKPSEHHKLDRT